MLLNYKVTPRRLEITSASSSATYGTRQPQVQFGMPVLLGMTRNAGCGAPKRKCQWAPSARPQRPQLYRLATRRRALGAWLPSGAKHEAFIPNTRLVPTVSSPVNYAISHHEQHGRRYARCSCGASINEWIILSGLVCPRCAPSGATKNDHKHVSVYLDSSVDKLTHRARLLQARKPNAPAEWMQKLPQMARRLEESLFRSALSFVSYSGMRPRASEF